MEDDDKEAVMGKATQFISECIDDEMSVALIAINEETGQFRMSTIDADEIDTMNMLLTAAKVMGDVVEDTKEGRTLN